MLQTQNPPAGPAVHRRPVVAALRSIAVVILGGLTAMEVLALVIGFVAVVGLLWSSGAVRPETLVTNVWLRALWALAVLAVLRPVTWIPYAIVFLGIRRLVGWLVPGAGRTRNVVANVATLAILALSAAFVLAAASGAARWTSSVLGLLTGTVRLEDLGVATGRWDGPHVFAVAAAFVLVRPVIPPFDLQFDLAVRPLLGFVDGGRGRFDTWLTIVAAALAAVAGVTAGLNQRAG